MRRQPRHSQTGVEMLTRLSAARSMALAVFCALTAASAHAFSMEDLADSVQKRGLEMMGRIRENDRASAEKQRAENERKKAAQLNAPDPIPDPNEIKEAYADQINVGFASDYKKGVPQGEILILDADEFMKRAQADLDKMYQQGEQDTLAQVNCTRGADPRRDPAGIAQISKCLNENKPPERAAEGIFVAEHLIGGAGVLEKAWCAKHDLEKGCPLSRGVITTRLGPQHCIVDDHPEDVRLLWITIVDTSRVGKDKHRALPPGARITSFDDYVAVLKGFAAKYPLQNGIVVLRSGAEQKP